MMTRPCCCVSAAAAAAAAHTPPPRKKCTSPAPLAPLPPQPFPSSKSPTMEVIAVPMRKDNLGSDPPPPFPYSHTPINPSPTHAHQPPAATLYAALPLAPPSSSTSPRLPPPPTHTHTRPCTITDHQPHAFIPLALTLFLQGGNDAFERAVTQNEAMLPGLRVLTTHKVLGFGFWVLGFGFWVLGFGFWVLGLGLGFGVGSCGVNTYTEEGCAALRPRGRQHRGT